MGSGLGLNKNLSMLPNAMLCHSWKGMFDDRCNNNMLYAIFYMLYHSWKGMFDDHCNNNMRECATGVEECEKLSNTESAGMAVACVCGSHQSHTRDRVQLSKSDTEVIYAQVCLAL